MLAAQRASRGGAAGALMMSPLQMVVMQAQAKRREKQLHEEDFSEFADVPAAIASSQPVDTLGKGNFGQVRLIWHTPTKRAYALKEQNVDSAKARAAVAREVASMRDGASPFLIRFFGETAPTPNTSHMLLEFLNGGDLKDLLNKRGHLPPDESRFYIACLVCAFDALHAADWVHRDLKLENVMIGPTGHAKLIDCGLAKQLKESQHTFTMCGTPVYFAPEIVKHTGYGRKAELWALGILLHELLSGNPPFLPDANAAASAAKGGRQGGALMQLFDKIVKQPAEMKEPCFTDASKDLINMLLRKKPQERIGFGEIRTSIFFEGFNWTSFEGKQMKAPFIPARHPRLQFGR
jgi:serine/threonine protein kinase